MSERNENEDGFVRRPVRPLEVSMSISTIPGSGIVKVVTSLPHQYADAYKLREMLSVVVNAAAPPGEKHTKA